MKHEHISMKKISCSFLFVFATAIAFAQASGSSSFRFKVKFAPDIPLDHIDVHYIRKSGNNFTSGYYTVDRQITRSPSQEPTTLLLVLHFLSLFFQ